MYAGWPNGATEADIHAIKQAMEKRPAPSTAFLWKLAPQYSLKVQRTNRAKLIVIRPQSPEFGEVEFGSRKWLAEQAIESI